VTQAVPARRERACKTSTRLADERELIYFDERPGRANPRPDTRRILPASTVPDIRRDALLDEWVIIAGHRQARTHLPAAGDCPLCASTAARATEIPEYDYDVAVFENRFPSLNAGRGRCEVVCFTAEHDTSFARLSEARVATVLDAWIDRTRALSALPGVEHVFVFENRGEEIGVTLAHPHGQIYAYPFVPPRAQRMVEVAAAASACAHCTAIAESGPRVIAETDSWLAFVPFAARWPFELHLYPRRHIADLTELDDAERQEFPALYLDLLRRFDGVFANPMPYIAAWQQAPVRLGRDRSHLFLQLFTTRRAPDKLKFLAGSESAMGAFINDIAPEHAAEILRAA
jgi:UDPglucose--hexose-1-phosphate uridylyltransferase